MEIPLHADSSEGPLLARTAGVTIDRRSDIRSLLEANSVLLPEGVTVMDVAARCRGAVLMLLESGHQPWGKPELAQWLTNAYRWPTSFAKPREIGIPPSSRRMPIQVDKLEELLAETRSEVHAAFTRVAETTDISFSYAAIHGGFIERCQDAEGAKGWVPVDRQGMRLSERAISLIAVDYLVRPADYLGLISVCEECGRVSFDALCRVRRACHRHRESQSRVAVANKA